MKRVVFIGILLFSHYYGSTCSFIPESFCRTLDIHPDDLVVSGIIVAIDDTGIDLEVIEILRGEESREIIRIWDGTDFDCNGIHSMAAADIGNLYDTVIIILPMIVTIENDWDVIGDYRRPHPYAETSELLVEGGNATGFISGDALAPPHYNLWSMNYDDFRNSIIANGDCSSIILSADDYSASPDITVNNPFESLLRIQLNRLVSQGFVKLYSMTGNVLLMKEITAASSIELELYDIPSGMYLVEVYTEGWREIIKVIKQHSR